MFCYFYTTVIPINSSFFFDSDYNRDNKNFFICYLQLRIIALEMLKRISAMSTLKHFLVRMKFKYEIKVSKCEIVTQKYFYEA